MQQEKKVPGEHGDDGGAQIQSSYMLIGVNIQLSERVHSNENVACITVATPIIICHCISRSHVVQQGCLVELTQ